MQVYYLSNIPLHNVIIMQQFGYNFKGNLTFLMSSMQNTSEVAFSFVCM